VVALAVMVVLCLGVLAASLVDLAGGSGTAATTTATTVARAPATVPPAQATAPARTGLPGSAPGTTTPRITSTPSALPRTSRVPRVTLPTARERQRARKGSAGIGKIEERLRRLGLISGAK
jgi:hypothetical protein